MRTPRPTPRGAGGIRADDPELPALSQVESRGPGRFQFHTRNFFLTWSQIGDRPNQLVEDLLTNFPARIECMCFSHPVFKANF